MTKIKPFLVAVVFFYVISSPAIGHGFKMATPQALLDLPENVAQAVLVKKNEEEIFKAVLTLWQKKEGEWVLFSALPTKAVMGRNGFAKEGEKEEGDGKTPSGVYALIRSFGYEEGVSTKLDYRQAGQDDFWVDDPQSPQYNQWIKETPHAKSFERLKRDDELYKYAVVIEYNTEPVVAGKGSAIFLHIWRAEDKPTAGCVAVSEGDMIQLLQWLDPSQNPMILLGGDNFINKDD